MKSLFSFSAAQQQSEPAAPVKTVYRGGYGYACHRTGICPCLPCSLHHAHSMRRAKREAWNQEAFINEKAKHHDTYRETFVPALV